MRVSILTAALVATPVLAYPGMKNTFAEIQSRQDKSNNGGKSTELLGDLVTLDDSKLTPVGKSVKQLLTGSGSPESDDSYSSGQAGPRSIRKRGYGSGGGGNSGGGGGGGGGGAPPSGGGGAPPSGGGGAPPSRGGGGSPAPGGGPRSGAPPPSGGGSYGGAPPSPGGGGSVPVPGPKNVPTPGPPSPKGGSCPPKDTPECAADACCIWKYIADDLQTTFRGESGRCTDFARAAIRLGFHDAGGWSKGTGQLGGADGSIILAPEEIKRDENRGLEEIVEQTKTWFSKYQQYGISMADLIQFSANVATVVCPMGPRVRTFVGRKDSSVPAPHDLLPAVTGSADYLIDLFGNKTISSYGLISLIGAHTTSQQRYVDPQRAGDPQDSTPGVWDVKFYSETIGNAPARVFKFASDIVLSKDSRTSAQFKAFAGPGGQSAWNEGYAREYIRLSLLGVYNINDLAECTKALPARWAGIGFNAADQGNVDQWLTTKGPVPKIPDQLREGHPIGPPPRPAGPNGSKDDTPAAPPKGSSNTPSVPTYNTPTVPPKDDTPKGNTPAAPPKGSSNTPSGPSYNTPAAPPKGDTPKGNSPSAPPKGNTPTVPTYNSPAVPPKGDTPKGNSPAVPNGNTPSAPPKGNTPSGPSYNTPAAPPKGDTPKGNSPAVPNGNAPSGSQDSKGGYGY
ncbi:ligninase H2 precursor [Colletotrichum tofieldiae]|uniref:Peroxidase n=1 Tax=Colletotrichum tofieldiae TaxID=708197 RepID=A0A166T770_9PEZI|nr:ligninase H2 precursor [Colletotrichum tofieldiae]GKT65638.1 ligninase H2 precursor [Colletotrichum tofieldiae]